MASPPTTPLDYNGYVAQICNLAVVQCSLVGNVQTPADAQVATLIPQMLNYAELRIQRDLDLNALTSTRTTYTTTANTNVLPIATGDFVTIDTVTLTSGNFSTPLLPVAKEYIQNVYNSSTYVAIPTCYAPYGGDLTTGGQTSQNLLLGPTPDQSYAVSITGLIRSPSLNSYVTSFPTGQYTMISTYYPDLLIMASMVFMSAYQRNFGTTGDDPQMGTTYENQYKALLIGAGTEAYRQKNQASAWTAKSSSPVATPTRP